MSEKIPNFKPMTRGEMPEAPEWIDRFIAPLNRQIQALTSALQGGIGPAHEDADTREIQVRHGVTVEVFSSRVKGRPRGALILAAEHPVRAWRAQPVDSGKLELTVYFDAPEPAGDVGITVKVLGG